MKYSPDTYRQMFDALLSEELLGCSSAADEQQIFLSAKKVLGCSIRAGIIKGYSNLCVHSNFDVTFIIVTPDNAHISLRLLYEA